MGFMFDGVTESPDDPETIDKDNIIDTKDMICDFKIHRTL